MSQEKITKIDSNDAFIAMLDAMLELNERAIQKNQIDKMLEASAKKSLDEASKRYENSKKAEYLKDRKSDFKPEVSGSCETSQRIPFPEFRVYGDGGEKKGEKTGETKIKYRIVFKDSRQSPLVISGIMHEAIGVAIERNNLSGNDNLIHAFDGYETLTLSKSDILHISKF